MMSYAEIYVTERANASQVVYTSNWEDLSTKLKTPYTKYSIKETDFRVKTATFTSPYFFDLTTSQYLILIKSDYHENFAGIILDVEYDEDTGLYSYQCQDWSRKWISKMEMFIPKVPLLRVLRALITLGYLPVARDATQKELAQFEKTLSGLQPVELYDQSMYEGNVFKGNPMKSNVSFVARDKTYIELIRDLVYSQAGYFDVHFTDNGILCIDPISKTDWENTGLMLTDDNYYGRKFKFSTTNALTGVRVKASGTEVTSGTYHSSDLIGLDLSAFFGANIGMISNPNDQSKAVTTTTTTSKTTTKKTTTTTANNKYGNPYNNKKKNIIVSADGGSGDFRSGIIGKLKADGWNVKDLGTGPGTHSTSYNILNKKYSVNLTIYNGVDPKTIDEPVTGWLKGRHEKYGVQLVMMFDTRHWTTKTGKYNKKGLWYKRHGDFRGYRVPKAWDDNYSGARSGVLIEDLHKWYLKYYPRAMYCCGVTVSEAYKQFKAGGYLKMKGYVK